MRRTATIPPRGGIFLIMAAFFLTALPAQAKVENKSWYFYFSSSISHPTYDNALTADVQGQKNEGGISPSAGVFDLPGIYYAVNERTLVGPVASFMFEHVAKDWRDGSSLAVHVYSGSLSVIRFFSGAPAEGFFVRGDLGYGHLTEIRERTYQYRQSAFDGATATLAAGYSFKFNRAVRMVLQASSFYTAAGNHSIKGLAVGVGVLL